MGDSVSVLNDSLQKVFPDLSVAVEYGEVTLQLAPEQLLTVCKTLRDSGEFAFEQLLDLCVVDYLHYGRNEWNTTKVTASGFSRGVHAQSTGRLKFGVEYDDEAEVQRFAVVYHLLSYRHNRRLRLEVFVQDQQLPVVPSVINLWPSADWYEREAFDLFGVLFEGHPDLRRLLTDYGFIGHPFRKDFPLIGNVEMRYDPEKKRVVYEPVSIEPRVLVPKVIRQDNRYAGKDPEEVKDA